MVVFDFWQQTGEPQETPRYGPEPVLHDIRRHMGEFEDGFTFTLRAPPC
jgi:hypothetical protein